MTHADRHVTYAVAVVARIAEQQLVLPSDVASDLEQAALSLGRLDAAAELDASIVPLLRAESSASSRIEQIEVRQRHIGRALEGIATKRSAREVAANVQALRTAVDIADRSDLHVAAIHAIHSTLMPDERWAGQMRDAQSWIGGSDHSPRDARYVPPPPDHVIDLLEDLIAFMVRDDIPSLAQAAVAHAQFECIHPYVDGNGRTGRAPIHVILRRRGVVTRGIAPLSLALVADRQALVAPVCGRRMRSLRSSTTSSAMSGREAPAAAQASQTVARACSSSARSGAGATRA